MKRKSKENNMQNQISNNWTMKRLDEVAIVTMGQSPASSSYNSRGVGVPFLQGTPPVVDSMGAAIPNQWTSEPTRVVEAGTALMTVRAPVGELFTTNDSVCLGRGLAGIKANDDVSQIYLNYYLQFSKKQLDTLSQGSTFTAINSGDLKEIQINLPSFKQQEYVGNVLNIIDQSIAKTDQIIKKTETLKQGLMQDLLSRGVNHSIYKLKEIVDITSSKRVMVSDYVEGGIPFYRSTEIIKKSKNIPLSNLIYISQEKFNFFKERFGAPKTGEILVTAVGTIGNVYLVKEENFYFKDGNLLWIKNIKENILPEYLKMLLSSKLYYEKLNLIAGGSSQKALTIEKMGSIEIFIPSIVEQKRLIDILSSMDGKQIVNVNILDALNQLKEGIMQDIFSQKLKI